ncbi:peptide N-acetyl-beta-D-glucosaminyl asparaginase amidase A-domain-containing protein [Diaporthe sp. PMI_573]|nr:peptide N-acetyl-beta-D-glucosaminyl asparaginase amidase A-domain-containing protein [Diaporthaceae sp. PMI_573]
MVKPHIGRQQRRRSSYAPLAVCLVVVAALTALGLCHHRQHLQWPAFAPTWSESAAPSDRDLLSSAALASAATAAAAAASPHHPGVTTGHVGSDQTEHAAAESSSESVAVGVPGVIRRQTTNVTTTSATAAATVLEVFQVHQPVLTPSGPTLDDAAASDDDEASAGSAANACSVVLMDHVFAFSYGAPFVGAYTPPDCDFNRVVINFTVVSEGRQYDRLALMYLNDTEVWRTSTAEPTAHPGIRWTYLKDMTEYLSLWKSQEKIIFDLGNLITDVYTGSFNTTLTATFFNDEVDVATAAPADLIIPISARKSSSDGVSQFTLPADNATNTISFPQNANRAVFSVSANGQSSEEFWWSNVLQSDTGAFSETAGDFTGYSPWREVQVLIDGQLAGVQWPFPVVFTGGVVPSLHRPVVGPDAFDLKEHEIDITPWLPVLCDGNSHTFTIYVAGLVDDDGSEASITQTVAASWYVTGKVFVWLDEEGSVTTGSAPVVDASQPSISVSSVLTQNATGANETLMYNTDVSRTFRVTSTVVSRNTSSTVSWTQDLSYSNKGFVSAYGFAQVNDFLISGTDQTTSSSAAVGADYKTEYKYPLWCNSTYGYSPEGNLTLYGRLIQGQQVYVEGAAVFPDGLEAFSSEGESPKYTGSLVETSKDGTAYFFQYADRTNSSGYGSTDQVFSFGGFNAPGGSIDATPDQELYRRHVATSNSTVTRDEEVVADGGSTVTSTGTGRTLSEESYAQAPLDGGSGGPRLFMYRQDEAEL